MTSRAIIEAEDPKSVFQRVTKPRVWSDTKTTTRFVDGKGNTISIDWTFGSPLVGWIYYQGEDPNNAAYGADLLKAAYDYLRSRNEYRVRVSSGTSRYKSYGTMFDVDADDPAEIGNLVHQVEPECYTGASGKVRYITLESVLSLDPHGSLALDERPKAPHSIWTQRREQPYRRVRTLSNGRPLEIYVAYKKDRAPNRLLQLTKQYGPHVGKLALWAAQDLVPALQGHGIDLVVPMPSGEPLAKRFARLIANRLGVPYEDRIDKTSAVARVPIPKRKVAAQRFISVEGNFRGLTVLVVDDYVVTSASMQAAAIRLYKAGAKKVVGAALAI